MDETISFSILEIEKTKDKGAIRDAYRRLLVKTNPEDDPEGFKRLREAYEAANAYADRPDEEKREPKTPVEQWMSRVEKVYASFSDRMDENCWKELLDEDICIGLDTAMEARDALLGYLADHYRLKADIWRLIDGTFHMREESLELREKFHPNFVDFMLRQCENREDFPYEWFEGADDGDYDTFLYHYYDLCRQNDGGDTEAAARTVETLEAMPVFHPYLKLERARFEKNQDRALSGAGLIHELLEEYPEDIRILVFGGEVLWAAGEKEASAECFRKVLKEIPDHYMGNKFLAQYCLDQGEFEKAKEYCVEALRISSQEEELVKCMHSVNRELIRIYEKKLQEGVASDKDVMELGWCYLQNEEAQKGVELLEGRTVETAKIAEHHNLLSKCYFVERQYQKAAEEAKKCIPCIEAEAAAREAEASEEEKGKEKGRIPGRIAGACEIIAKALHVLAKEENGREGSSCQNALYEEALSFIDRALEQEKGSRNHRIEKIMILMDQGDDQGEDGDKSPFYERAKEVCSEMIEADGGDFYGYVLRQKCAYELFDGQGVVDNFYQAKEIYAGYSQIYELAADVFIKYNQYEDAKGILRQAEEAGVSSPKLSLLSLTIMREMTQSGEEAREAVKKSQELEKHFEEEKEQVSDEAWAEFYCECARCRRNLNTHDGQREALKYIEKALALKGDKLYRWIHANTLFDLRDYEKALPEYQYCAEAYGENELVYQNLARCLEQMNNWRKAVYYFKKALQVNPENQEINGDLVDIYTEQLKETGEIEYYQEGLPYADRQLELTPDAYHYIERGILHLEAGAFDAAEADFEEAARLEPENTYAFANWGCVYKYRGQYEKAIELFKKSIELLKDKETGMGYSNMGNCYERMEDYVKAAECYRKGHEMFPENQNFRDSLIRVYRKMEQLPKALELAETLYEKGSARYHMEAARIYTQMKRYEKALSEYSAVLRKNNRDLEMEALWGSAEVNLYYKKKPKAALNLYKRALELLKARDFGYIRTCRCMMECLIETGQKEEVLKYQKLALEAIREKYGSEEKYLKNYYYRRGRLYEIGCLYFYAGDLKRARDFFDEIQKCAACRSCNDRRCEDDWEAKGFLLEAEGRLEEALECYEQACKESKGNNLSISKVEKLRKSIRRRWK